MLKYQKYDDLDFTFFVGESETSLEDWMTLLREYSEAGTTKYELYDLREVTGGLDDLDVRRIASFSEQHRDDRPPGSKTAIVVNRALNRWLVRLYSILSQVARVNWETKEFSTIHAATDWLGINLSEVEGLEED